MSRSSSTTERWVERRSLRRASSEPAASASVGGEVDDLRSPARIKWRAALFAAAGAIVAVGFGGAAALVVPVAFPSVSVTVAVVAGAAAAMTAGVGKPLAAALIAVLILGIPAVGPLCVGIAIGWAASKIAPASDFN